MRNRFPGKCYRCGELCAKGDGHFEKIMGTKNGWRLQHAKCAIEHRCTNRGKEPPPSQPHN